MQTADTIMDPEPGCPDPGCAGAGDAYDLRRRSRLHGCLHRGEPAESAGPHFRPGRHQSDLYLARDDDHGAAGFLSTPEPMTIVVIAKNGTPAASVSACNSIQLFR